MKVAIIQYSTYGHVTVLAKALQEGVVSAGAKADIFQVPETLSENVLAQLHAPAKPTDIPIATHDTLQEYDALLLGVPTRFGSSPAQWNSFWDSTGSLWATGALYGKPAGLFVSTGTPGGGQEATLRSFVTYLVHHGMIYVPLGYGGAFGQLTSFDEPHGGSPWGSGTFAGADGSRQPNQTELAIAKIQGESFVASAKKIVAAKSKSSEKSEKKEKSAAKEVSDEKSPRDAQRKKAEADTQSSCAKCVVM